MKKGGGGWGGYTIRICFLARHELCFLQRLYIFHLQVMKGILRETVSVNQDLYQLVLTGC